MGIEGPRQNQNEKDKPLSERIEDNELRVQRLLGETQAHLARIPSGEELARTVEGQAKLLKLQDSMRRYNERIVTAVGAIANISLLARVFSTVPDGVVSPEAWHLLSEIGASATVSAALIGVFFSMSRGREFAKAAGDALDSMRQ